MFHIVLDVVMDDSSTLIVLLLLVVIMDLLTSIENEVSY